MTIAKKVRIGVAAASLIAIGGYAYSQKIDSVAVDEPVQEISTQQAAEDPQPDESDLLVLTGEEYKQLFLDSSQPNTKTIVSPPEITGSATLDARIVALAESRGYELQKVPRSQLSEYDGDLLQQKLAEAWQELKQQAKNAGIDLYITSAFRGVDEQKQLFVERLGSAQSDADINRVLSMTAPPGYSRHHSGYVIDIADRSASVFEYSAGYKWLSADNYLIPKKLGIIPSYPAGAVNQGPEPEPWEYVWVGQQLLYE
jgi:LAS superfamily LD-carboxypeptidase LdcB